MYTVYMHDVRYFYAFWIVDEFAQYLKFFNTYLHNIYCLKFKTIYQSTIFFLNYVVGYVDLIELYAKTIIALYVYVCMYVWATSSRLLPLLL